MSSENIGDPLGGIILDRGWFFWFLGSDCCIGLSTLGGGISTLGGGLVLSSNGVNGCDTVSFLFKWRSVTNILLVSMYVGYNLVWLCSMVVISLNSFCRRDNSCMEDYFRWYGILFLSASTKFASTSMTAYSGVTVGFVMYLCLKNNVPETIFEILSFTHMFQHR